MERIIAVIETLFIPVLLLCPSGITYPFANTVEATANSEGNQCIEYDSAQKLIHINCESVKLTDIHNSLNDPAVLRAEGDVDENKAKVWILNAGIEVGKDASLIIDSSDTSWLKIIPTPTIQIKSENETEDTNYSDDTLTVINPTNKSNINTMFNITEIENGTVTVSKHNGDNPNGIHVHGSLTIDSVKITSWDPEKNDVIRFDLGKRLGEEGTKSDYDTAQPRAFIRVSKDATGTTDITNSEIAYLGYSCSRCAGLSYYGGEASQIKNSNIHHLLKGFYSKNAAHITIDNNTFHNNYLYGIDPHTGSHDLVITNNLVYNNNASGIICSKHCFNLLIEGNEAYNNSGSARGIAFSINTTNSIARNNYIHDQPKCISFNRESNHNLVYNNTLSDCKTGVYLSGTSNNTIHSNNIDSSQNGILIMNHYNKIYNNIINDSKYGIVLEPALANQSNGENIRNTSNTTQIDYEYLNKVASDNQILNTKNPTDLKKMVTNNTGN